MRVVVTGAAGFIGSNLVLGLNRLGIDDVIAVDDPEHFTKPFSVTRKFAFRGDLEATLWTSGISEYSCEENNRNVPDAAGVVTTEVKAEPK